MHGFIYGCGKHTIKEKERFTQVILDKQKQPISTVRTDLQKTVSFSIISLWPLWSLVFSFFPVPPPQVLPALGLSDMANSMVATIWRIILYMLVLPRVVGQNKLEA